MTTFECEYCIRRAEFRRVAYRAWHGDEMHLRLPCGMPSVQTWRTTVTFKLDSGAGLSALRSDVAVELGIDTDWKQASELVVAGTAGGGYVIGVRRTVDVYVEKWRVEIPVVVPIRGGNIFKTRRRQGLARKALKRRIGDANDVSFEIARNLLSMVALLKDGVVCCASDGVYLFQRRSASRS